MWNMMLITKDPPLICSIQHIVAAWDTHMAESQMMIMHLIL